jgi:hypothetical protein
MTTTEETVYDDDHPAPEFTDAQHERRGRLIEKKFLGGLTAEETAELGRLDHLLDYQADSIAFYRPILENARRIAEEGEG